MLSIKSKLALYTSAVSCFVLLTSFAIFIYFQYQTMRNELVDDIRVLGKSVAENCAHALFDGDLDAVELIVNTLRLKPDIHEARLMDQGSRVLTQFNHNEDPVSRNALVASLIGKDFLHHREPVLVGGQVVGELVIQAHLNKIGDRIYRYAVIGGIGFILYSILAFFLAFSLQRIISKPIDKLVQSMAEVARTKDYSTRLICDRNDEMGLLFSGFNNMLEEIEKREIELRKSETHLEHMAHHDPLTGLANRLLLSARLEQSISRSKRMKTSLAVMFIDLDRFKNINDSFGHDYGDQVLKLIGERLESVVRDADTVARIGGDEFIIVIEQVRKKEDLGRFAQKLMADISSPIDIDKCRFNVTATIGICMFPGDGDDVESLLKHADLAMYSSKDDGRNNYQFYSADMNQDSRQQVVLETRLRQALAQDHLVLHYQPQFDMQIGQLIGFEALLRWKDPEHGLIPPDEFISLAEESGLIIPIGEWVISEACQTLKRIQDRWPLQLRMAVNISPRQFRDESLVPNVAKALYRTELSPELLELEITESMVMDNVSDAIGKMNELKKIGVHLAVDDFGTGYSSLGYLKKFPLTRLKIDRSFVRDLTTNVSDQAIVNSIIALGKTLNFEIIAEGIETGDQFDYLMNAGCDQAQGYLLGRPAPLGDLTTLLDSLLVDRPDLLMK